MRRMDQLATAIYCLILMGPLSRISRVTEDSSEEVRGRSEEQVKVPEKSNSTI